MVYRAATVEFWQQRPHNGSHIINMPPMPLPRTIYQNPGKAYALAALPLDQVDQ